MKRILFQPFDLKKWFVIGFAAWLSLLGRGGFNYNYRFNPKNNAWQYNPALQNISDAIHTVPFWLLLGGIILLVAVLLALAVVLAWLRARGVFMFTDCMVKNRAAIADPWREFRREGNSFFLFSLLVGCGFLLVAAILALPIALPLIGSGSFVRLHTVYFISILVFWGAGILVLAVAWSLISQIMVVAMYCQRCKAADGFRRAISLVGKYPGEITLYCLFWIALALGAGFVSCAAICATCCIAAIPYLGTVILLPVWATLRGFTLFFFRQFGPDYDVWVGRPAPNELPSLPPPLPA